MLLLPMQRDNSFYVFFFKSDTAPFCVFLKSQLFAGAVQKSLQTVVELLNTQKYTNKALCYILLKVTMAIKSQTFKSCCTFESLQ